MVIGVILAGGTGTRMGNTKLPKQFLNIGSKPVIIHTIEKFVLNPNVDEIILSVPLEWIEYTENLLKQYNLDKIDIKIVEATNSRHDSVEKCCDFINKQYNITENDVVLIHDAVRPFISNRIIEDNIRLAKETGIVDTVIPAVDTIVKSEDKKTVNEIPNREFLFQGQTPQSFNIQKLTMILKSLTETEKKVLTDTCKCFIYRNEYPSIVYGETYNFKITNLFDLRIANMIVENGGFNDKY